ncbi:hypothetical protein D3C73_923910 [compost metagenome]
MCGFPRGDWQHDLQIVTYDVEQWMRSNADDQIEIAAGATVSSWSALALKTNAFAIANAGGDFHIKGFRNFLLHHAESVIYRQAIANGTGLLGLGFFQEDSHFHFNILAAHALTSLTMLLATGMFAEHGGENIGKIFGVMSTAMLRLAAKIGIVAVLSQLIIFGAAFVVFQHFIGFGDQFELFLGIRFGADVGVIFSCQSAIGSFDCLEIVRRLNP